MMHGPINIRLQVFLTWAMDGCERSDYALVPLNPGKEHPVPVEQEVGGLQTWSGHGGSNGNI
jgi:hypothetical protein